VDSFVSCGNVAFVEICKAQVVQPPAGAGVELCLQRALESSGVAAGDVNYVNAHATSTLAGDLQEYKALHRAFGSNPDVSLATHFGRNERSKLPLLRLSHGCQKT
jgi:3-oxoacyl-(acyl-carrier-protein) synthase